MFIAGLLLVGGYRVLNPEIDMPVGNLMQFFFLASNFFQPIQMLGNQYNQALTAMAGAERVFRLLDTPPDWVDPPDAVALPRIEGRVEFDDVSFAYVPGRTVLHEISFTAQPGQTIALVGHTGSGKSIDRQPGRQVLPADRRPRADRRARYAARSQTDSLRRQLGIVLQQNFLFSGTVLENIRVGRPDATEDEVRQAARRLDCLDLLEALPEGLHTQVGERGGSLSLGQRQLVCFARAMLADPRILILDEATSSVDGMTELRIQRALSRLLAESHQLRRGPSPEHHPPRRPGAGARPRPHRRARHARHPAGRWRRVRPPLCAVCAFTRRVIRNFRQDRANRHRPHSGRELDLRDNSFLPGGGRERILQVGVRDPGRWQPG